MHSAAIRTSRAGLILSALMLSVAPLVVSGSYSVVEHTLSESGGQGVVGAWALRTGVAAAAVSVTVMTLIPGSWDRTARRLLRIYCLALVLLVTFPATSWEPGFEDVTVATIHTGAAVVGGVAFILGVLAVSRSRPPGAWRAKTLDWIVIGAVALIPQIMLISSAPGVWQRLMAGVGYVWLLAETFRLEVRVVRR